MIRVCLRVVKKHPYVLVAVVGILMVLTPLAIVSNLVALGELFPSNSDAILQVLSSRAVRTACNVITVSGSAFVMAAVYWWGCTRPPASR